MLLFLTCFDDISVINEVAVWPTSTVVPRLTWLVYTQRSDHAVQFSLLPSAGWEVINGQGAVVVLFGWEDNRWSGVALAMYHILYLRDAF